jgi:dTDP-4-amino-4,6-dideoxygalactose transaminase
VGRGQVEVLDERVRQKRAVYDFYRNKLSSVPGISFLSEPRGFFSNRWLTTILIDPAQSGFTREDLRLKLDSENIESRPLWKPMHMQPVFEHNPKYTNGVSEKLFETGLCLPSGTNLSDADLNRICEIILGVARK